MCVLRDKKTQDLALLTKQRIRMKEIVGFLKFVSGEGGRAFTKMG